MAETLALTTPVTYPSRTTIHIERLTIDVDAQSMLIQWKADNGDAGSAAYPTPAPTGSSQPTGAALITSLNTANLSTISLVKRIIQRLQTDGYVAAGTISGTPS